MPTTFRFWPPRRATLLVAATLAAIVVTSLVLALSHPSASGRRAPALPRQRLAGTAVTLASLRGRPALIDFFASWCGPCSAEARTVEQTARALGRRATVVGVDWSDSRSYALAFVARFRWTFPVLADPNGVSGNAYGIEGLPTAFVLDPTGRIVRRLVGPQPLSSLLAAVDAAAGEGAHPSASAVGASGTRRPDPVPGSAS